jgi:outer membrane protein assembly factor BamB
MDFDVYSIETQAGDALRFVTTGGRLMRLRVLRPDGSLVCEAFDRPIDEICFVDVRGQHLAVVDAGGSDDAYTLSLNPDAATGTSPVGTAKIKWQFETDFEVHAPPVVGADGTIYVGSYDDNIYAVNPNGTERWRSDTGGDVRFAPAVTTGGTVYVSSSDAVYSINPNGSVRWRFPIGACCSAPVIAPDGTVYVVSSAGMLYALRPTGSQQGTARWTYPTNATGSPAVGADGTVYVQCDDVFVCAISDLGIVLIDDDRELKWKAEAFLTVNPDSVLVNNGTIYFTSRGENQYAFNANGTEKWRFDTGARDPGLAFGADGTIFVAAGNLIAINSDGTEQWVTTRSGGEVATDSDGTIYVSNVTLISTSNSDGIAGWEFDGIVQQLTEVAVGSDGTIYVGSEDNSLYALTPPAS